MQARQAGQILALQRGQPVDTQVFDAGEARRIHGRARVRRRHRVRDRRHDRGRAAAERAAAAIRRRALRVDETARPRPPQEAQRAAAPPRGYAPGTPRAWTVRGRAARIAARRPAPGCAQASFA